MVLVGVTLMAGCVHAPSTRLSRAWGDCVNHVREWAAYLWWYHRTIKHDWVLVYSSLIKALQVCATIYMILGQWVHHWITYRYMTAPGHTDYNAVPNTDWSMIKSSSSCWCVAEVCCSPRDEEPVCACSGSSQMGTFRVFWFSSSGWGSSASLHLR